MAHDIEKNWSAILINRISICFEKNSDFAEKLNISFKALLHEAVFSATCNAMLMTTKHCKLLVDMLHASTGFAMLQKVEDSSTFSLTCFTTFCCVASCRCRVLQMEFLLQFDSQLC